MLFGAMRSGSADTFDGRLRRARSEGYWRGARKAKLFILSVGKALDRSKAIDWLNTAIVEGRDELEAQHAIAR
jgi:hypothetical protein